MTTYFTVNGEFVLWKQPVCLVKQEISSDELLEAPVLPLDKPVRPLALCHRSNQ